MVSQTSIAKQRRNLVDGLPTGKVSATPPCTGGTKGKVYVVGTKRGFCSIIFPNKGRKRFSFGPSFCERQCETRPVC